MTARQRVWLFFAGGAVLAGLLVWAISGLPGFGRYPGPYGTILNAVAVPERNTTDVVTAVNLDYRGLDTIGEEFILFVSVTAVMVLLRKQRPEVLGAPEEAARGRRVPGRDDAALVLGVAMSAVIACFGLYIVGHGQLTPGGGFQGGAILMTGPALLYLAGGFRALQRSAPAGLLEVAEGIGAGGFVALGLASLAAGAAFLQDVLPLGTRGEIASSGTLPIINTAIGLEVAAGLMLAGSEFLVQLVVLRWRAGR
jgi:multicomponent Na+:H+ antiporter subunit B